MANHTQPGHENAGKSFAEDGAMILTARRAIDIGEEILVTYGKVSNAQLLQVYGFTLEDNKHDFAVVDIDVLVQHISKSFQEELLRQALLMPDVDGSLSRWQPLSARLEQAVQNVFLASETAHMSFSSADEMLKYLCRTTLSSFSTTLAQDVELLRHLADRAVATISHKRRRSALLVRVGQKRLLEERLEARPQ